MCCRYFIILKWRNSHLLSLLKFLLTESVFKIIAQYLSKVIHVKCLELGRDKGRQPANEDNIFLFTRIFYVSSSLIF